MAIVTPAELGLDFLDRREDGCESNNSKAKPRQHPLSTNPELTDPRKISLSTDNPCCACKPAGQPACVPTFPLKSEPLHNCYWCCPSKECIHREEVRCKRWQQFYEQRTPECEKVFCNGRFLTVPGRQDPPICDFRSKNMTRKIGPREQQTLDCLCQDARRCVCEDLQGRIDCWTPTPRKFCRPETLTEMDEEARTSTYVNEDPHTFWYQKLFTCRRTVEGATPIHDLVHPFHKNTSFTSAVLEPL